MSIDPIPDGGHAVIPYLCVPDGARALAFYRDAFGAVETMRLVDGTGKVQHAEFRIGAARVMLAEEFPELDFRSPQSLGGSPVCLVLYVEDIDARFALAVAAGASVRRELRNEFHGDRTGNLVDPFGHAWTLASRIEHVDDAEIRRRFAQYAASPSPEQAPT